MIFVISLHRSGTQSVDEFFKNTRYHAIHNPSGRSHFDFQNEWDGREYDLDYIFESIISRIHPEFNAVGDNPMAVLYKQAYERFPSAKFILTTRDVNKWINSVKRHIGTRDFVPAEKVQYWHYLNYRPSKITDITDLQLNDLYLKHTQTVIDYFNFKKANDRLCIICLDDDSVENGEKLSHFLEIPIKPFPWVDKKGKNN